MATERQRQQRELEEIRRSFLEVGTKVSSLFEPAKPNRNGDEQRPAPAPVELPPPEGRPTWTLAVLAFACLLLGVGLGFVVHRPGGSAGPTPTSIVTRTVRKAVPVAPAACLETARRPDILVDLYTRNVRDNRLTLALKSYTLASQACRKEASP